MWIIVFITLVALIIGKFVYDNIRHTSAMKRAGGMAVKYAEIVDACLACSGARILQETPTFISIGGKYTEHNISVDYAFWIQHTFNNKLIVKYVLKGRNMPQRVIQQWDFPQQFSQQKMIQSMQSILDELAPLPTISNGSREDVWLCHKYKDLISRLKMEGTEESNLYTVTVMCNCEDCYEFYLDMKFGHYKYNLTSWLGKLRVSLDSQSYIKGEWEFPSDMSQSVIADKIEADINAMVMKKYDNSDFYG